MNQSNWIRSSSSLSPELIRAINSWIFASAIEYAFGSSLCSHSGTVPSFLNISSSSAVRRVNSCALISSSCLANALPTSVSIRFAILASRASRSWLHFSNCFTTLVSELHLSCRVLYCRSFSESCLRRDSSSSWTCLPMCIPVMHSADLDFNTSSCCSHESPTSSASASASSDTRRSLF